MQYRCCLLHTDHLIVHYDPLRQCLFNQWRGHQDEPQLREHGHFIQYCLLAHACRSILSDHTHLCSSWDAEVVAHQIAGRYAALGVEFFAWVPS